MANLFTKLLTTPEKWIWVEGYKGTDKNMCCRDITQYEIGKEYRMPEDTEIKCCVNGFHLSIKLESTFNYYGLCDDNRFFKVRALVREDEYNRACSHCFLGLSGDKLAAKAIIFTEEITTDIILESYLSTRDMFKNLGITSESITEQDKIDIRSKGMDFLIEKTMIKNLTDLGYSEVFAKYVVDNDLYRAAMTIGSNPDTSMDVKVLSIFLGMYADVERDRRRAELKPQYIRI